MPVIICSWCNYIGSGKDYLEMLADVLSHEEDCSERLAMESVN